MGDEMRTKVREQRRLERSEGGRLGVKEIGDEM